MALEAPQAPALEVSCETCGATVIVEQGLRTADCPYCASSNVVERPPSPDRPQPTFALGFTVARERAVEIARRWLSSRGPFVHGGVKRGVVEHVRGVYLPAYLYGASADSDYRAEIGENYQVTVTYTTTDSKGRAVTRTRTETRTEWRQLTGRYEAYVVDILVTASKGIGNAELELVEPFDLRALRKFSSSIISGWIAEEPSMASDECLELARAETVEQVGRKLGDFMPGDSHRRLHYQVDVHDEMSELLLLPLWVFAVRYSEEKPPIRLIINGQTGKAAGKVPLSIPKIALAVVLVIALIGLIALAFVA